MSRSSILVAGIGNIFMGDDGFGVEVVRRLVRRPLPPSVRAADFGIRGFDLACALLEPHDRVVLIDVARRGGPPGTLYLMELEDTGDAPGALHGHGMIPTEVFRTVRTMGGSVKNAFMVACEPESFGDPEVGRLGLSGSVEAAIDEAVRMVDTLVRRSLAHA